MTQASQRLQKADEDREARLAKPLAIEKWYSELIPQRSCVSLTTGYDCQILQVSKTSMIAFPQNRHVGSVVGADFSMLSFSKVGADQEAAACPC